MDILNALLDLLIAVGQFWLALAKALLPWLPLIAWIAFWTLAVDWVRLRTVLLKGGWIGVAALGLVAVLVWGVIAPPESGVHSLLGLQVSNFVGKTVYVTTLIVIMLLCGSTQLSGCCDAWLNLQPPLAPVLAHGHDSGHGHDGRGHDHTGNAAHSHSHDAPDHAHGSPGHGHH